MNRHTLDITTEQCPMTFVKTLVKLSKMQTGEIVDVLLMEGIPLNNLPKNIAELGHAILSTKEIGNGIYEVSIKKMR